MSGHWWQRKPKTPDLPKVPPFVPPPREPDPEPMVVEESAADTAILKKLGFRREK